MHSKFNTTILEALTENIDIDKLIQILKPILTKQNPNISFDNNNNIQINVDDYVIITSPIKILSKQDFEENEEIQTNNNDTNNDQNQPVVDANIINSLNNLSNSTNSNIANAAKQTLAGLNNNINAIGAALLNKTQKIAQDITNG